MFWAQGNCTCQSTTAIPGLVSIKIAKLFVGIVIECVALNDASVDAYRVL